MRLCVCVKKKHVRQCVCVKECVGAWLSAAVHGHKGDENRGRGEVSIFITLTPHLSPLTNTPTYRTVPPLTPHHTTPHAHHPYLPSFLPSSPLISTPLLTVQSHPRLLQHYKTYGQLQQLQASVIQVHLIYPNDFPFIYMIWTLKLLNSTQATQLYRNHQSYTYSQMLLICIVNTNTKLLTQTEEGMMHRLTVPS